MKQIVVKDILRECQGTLILGNENIICENFSKDTRQINEGDIYLGIKGEKVNGSIFYEDALKKGAKGCILQNVEVTEDVKQKYADRFIILVDNVVSALQKLAKYKRSLYNIPVIAITGSVGKTSTKDIIASVMQEKYNVLKTQGNYNNEIGMPLTILELKDHNAMVLEMGMSALGEISLLTNIAKPTTAIITNIGSSHIGELGSRENILKAKLEIVEGLQENGKLFINIDNDLLSKWYKSERKENVFTYGIEEECNIKAYDINLHENDSSFKIKVDNVEYEVNVPVGGKHFIYNALGAIAIGLEYKIDINKIISGISKFELTKRRMEVIETNDNIKVINDSYNASYESIKAAIEYVCNIKSNKKILVLGDVLELGDFSKKIHENIGAEVAKNNVDILVTVGSQAKYIAQKTKELSNNIDIYVCENNQEAADRVNKIKSKNDIILVKASNGMKFNEIVEKII